jgi:hypothetical protein
MAYVRRKGNQVVMVHGERDAESGKVQQRTLFVFYSKAEALAATGKSSHWFQQTLQDEYPAIRFDWKKLNAGIKEHMTTLPDLYAFKTERVDGRFRSALTDFARELLIADPQTLISSARLMQEQRRDLEYVRDLISRRLECSNQEESEWNKDDPFYWSTLMNRRDVPPEGREELSTLYERLEYEKAEALAQLLIDCWSNYAEGHNYLGLIAMDRGELNTAREQFERAMDVGRTLFPRRIRKNIYWSDHSTRPYIRAIIYSAQTCNRMGEFSTALSLCERLDHECHQDITAATERIPIYLNSRSWELAAKAARYVHKIFPQENLPLAFALHELGEEHAARVHFLSGAIQFPRTARMLCGHPGMKNPESWEETNDHNNGVGCLRDLECYFENRENTARRFFKGILKDVEVTALIKEADDVRRKWREHRSSDRRWFDRMNEMKSIEFAEAKAAEIWPDRRS